MAVQVAIEGNYVNGHRYTRVVDVREPEPEAGEAIADWWWDVVFPHTGDGMPGHLGGYHVAEVLAAPNNPDLVGLTSEWSD